jgi:large subunit ribosomal protein L15
MTMIHDIVAPVPAYKDRLRRGRGESSGHGKTSGRGTKGAGARTGKNISLWHEGGQTRVYRRLPQHGFSNYAFANRFFVVNVGELDRFFADGETVDAAALVAKKLVPDVSEPVKLLGNGEVTHKLTVVAGWFSRSAVAKIVAAGGTVKNLKNEAFEFPKPKKRFVPREPAKKAKAPKGEQAAPEAAATPEAAKDEAAK